MTVPVEMTMDLDPPYTVTGKSVEHVSGPLACGEESTRRLTVFDAKLVDALAHDILIVTQGELAEGRQPRRPHPDLEGLVLVEVGRRVVLRVAVRVSLHPVRRRSHLIPGVLRLAIERFVALPSDIPLGHRIGLVVCSAAERPLGIPGDIEQHRAREGVVELRIGDQAAGIVGKATILHGGIESKRVTETIVDGAVVERLALELLRVQ